MPARCLNRQPSLLIVTAVAAAFANGCSQNVFRTGLWRPGVSTPTPGLSPPVIEGPPVVSADTAPPMLPPTVSFAPAAGAASPDAMLAGSRDQASLLQEEVMALRDQLASTSSQLAAARQLSPPSASGAIPPSGPPWNPAQQPAAPVPPAGGSFGPSAVQASMGQINLPDAQVRLDGSVVRIEIQSDKLFEGATSAIMPGGAAMLTQVAAELVRVYPNHFIGIEGHLDSEPLPAGSQLPPHQLTAARAAAVFDFFTSRTPLPARQLFLVAHGPNHPVVSNATATGRARNRRIELVVYPETVAPSAGG